MPKSVTVYAILRALVKDYITLIFACMNLKKLAMKKLISSSTIFLFLINLKTFPTSIEKVFVYSLFPTKFSAGVTFF